jgi:hypothetical protein
MNRKLRNRLLFAGKLLLAAGLLAWVLTKVHWHNYVVDAEGQSYPVVSVQPDRESPETVTIATGVLGLGERQTRPADAFTEAYEGAGTPIHGGFASSFRRTRPSVLAAAIAGFLVAFFIMAVRWWFLLRLQDIHLPLWESVRLTFLGLFFNMVVPGTVGGDVVKAYYVSKHTPGKPAAALLSIFVDRVLGLTELTLMAAVMLSVVVLSGLESFAAVRVPALVVGGLIVAVAGILLFLLSGRFRRVFHLHKLYGKLPIAHHIAAAGDAARLYRRRIGGLVRAILITLGSHIFFVGSIALVGVSLSLRTDWYNYFVYIPLVYILGAVPITPGGVGLVETFYVQFFQSPTVNPSEILAMALLARLIPIFWGLPGAIVAVTGPKLPRTAAMEAELGLTEDEPATASE